VSVAVSLSMSVTVSVSDGFAEITEAALGGSSFDYSGWGGARQMNAN